MTQLTTDLAALKLTPESGQALVEAIFGNDIPKDGSFFPPLVCFAQYLDFSDQAKEIVGLVWARAFSHLDPAQIEVVLFALPEVGQFLGLMLEALPFMVERQRLSPATLIRFTEGLAEKLSGKWGGQGLDRALERFADNQPNETVEALDSNVPSDRNLGILGVLLGRLRMKFPDEPIASKVVRLENEFKASPELLTRNVFYQSWLQEAFEGRLTAGRLNQLCSMADSHGTEDIHHLIVLIATFLKSTRLDLPAFQAAIAWLEKRASPDISDIGKMHIVEFASFFDKRFEEKLGIWRPNLAQLVISILPIAAEHKRIWDSLEFYLSPLLPNDPATFRLVFEALAERNGKNWLKVLKEHPGMTQLLSQMKTSPQNDLIGSFCLSPDRIQRHIGLFFFDELDFDGLPTDLMNMCDVRSCWLLLNEVISANLTAESAGRCLISLLGQADRVGQEFTQGLKSELLMQAKNYPGACGELFVKHAGENVILKEVVAQRETYFQALVKAKQSPVSRMQIPGYHQALEEFHRNFYNEIQEGSVKYSALLSVIPSVKILYGHTWSSFHGNQLSDPTDMHKFSHSVELPRMELIDPEQMQLRRLQSHVEIEAIERDVREKP
jgi:hypothetical protein